MKKRIVFALLVFVCLSGSLAAQTITNKLKKPTFFDKRKNASFYDKLRERIFDEKMNSDQVFKLYLEEFREEYLKKYQKEPVQEITSLESAPEPVIEDYQEWLSAKVNKLKFNTIKLGGKIDFGGENGTTYSIDSGFSFEIIKLLDFFDISADFNAGLKRDSKITSFELTAGGKFSYPSPFNFVCFYSKIGIGPIFRSGGSPTLLIWNSGPGLGFIISKKHNLTLDVELLFYRASKPIFSDGDTKKNDDMVLNIAITYSFTHGLKF